MSRKVGVDPNSDYTQVSVKSDEKLLDTRLMAGPLAERGCTDILCCLLFIANILLLGYIAIAGYKMGQPERLVAVYDASKRACGLDVADHNYLYFAIPYPGEFNRTTCVTECPNYSDVAKKPKKLNCSVNSVVQSCDSNCLDIEVNNNLTYPPDPKKFNISEFVCIFNSTIFFDRICYPQQVLELLKSSSSFTQSINMDSVTKYVSDLKTTSTMIYASFGIAFVLGILYLLFTRVFAGVLVWLAIFLYFVGIGILTYLCYQRHQQYDEVAKDKTGQYTYEEQTSADTNSQNFLYITYVMLGICAASFLGFLCIFNKLRLAVAIIKTAAIFVKDEFLIILVPPVATVFLFGLWIWWILTAIFVYSLGDIKGDGQTPFATVTLTELNKQQLWYFIFGGLWCNAFIQAVNDFIIASAVCIWYFSQGSGQGSTGAIRTSVYRAFRYHLGSLAFGSLILAIVQFIRIILEYMRYQMEKMGANKNKVTKCIIDCLSCYMACFERFIRFLNKNAYIQVALTGKSFCPAAKEAFETIWANSMRYSLVEGIGGAFLFVGKAFISIATVTIFYYIITGVKTYKEKLFSPILPCIIVFIIAYSIGVLFMQIYGMACDAILACFIYDEDLNKQNGGQSAQHCPETLREFFETPMLVQKMKDAEKKSG